ncbi:glycosyltransferase family 1 protein [Segetibacter koreensis]|uniref:glycosyltransferase family 1 protein n=1 Tax=Segetibacter koreensis TaxID=398037 RepID=UPI00038054A1|nr:glycosyltransferase family 1 protein [Segetibacter koreensis]
MTVKSVYFYCVPYTSPDKAAFQHSAITLAEGLSAIGIKCYSNINYWKYEGNSFLFQTSKDVIPDDCSAVVLNNGWFSYGHELPPNLFKKNRKYLTVYLDHADGIRTESFKKEFRNFDVILKAHYNSFCVYPGNIYPTVFGLSNRIIGACEGVDSFESRNNSILFNFRVKHSLRGVMVKEFRPLISEVLDIDESTNKFDEKDLLAESYDKLMWEQTGRRHYPTYYQKLKSVKACACFGGYFLSPFPKNQSSILGYLVSKTFEKLNISVPGRINQWDSWRFWETLASGAVAFHIDFEKYGICLPEQPGNFKHYVGVDLDNYKSTIDRLKDEPNILKEISTQGRQWALEFYSPTAIAGRFVRLAERF